MVWPRQIGEQQEARVRHRYIRSEVARLIPVDYRGYLRGLSRLALVAVTYWIAARLSLTLALVHGQGRWSRRSS